MSSIYLDVYCPNCDGEEILVTYDDESNNIKCECLECGNIDPLSTFNYLIYNDNTV